jgi:hypothetical protein
MGKMIFDISMSLDGFMTAAKQRPEEPLGEGASASTSGPSAATRTTGRSWPAEPAASAR